MDDFENSYGSEYDDLKLYPDESPLVTILKGLLGAVIGALPGMILWIILGKIGFIASGCGFLLAAGIVLGYGKMTGKAELPVQVGVIVCLAVMLAAVYFAQRIVWTWELTEAFGKYLSEMNKELYAGVSEENKSVVERIMNEFLLDEFGFTKGTFSDCSSHFGELLEKLDVKDRFIRSLGESYLFAFLGGGILLAGVNGKTAKKI